MTRHAIRRAVLAALVCAPAAAWATNGMNMETYGPIAGGMGGASFAYDNGTAAVINNPATLGLMEDGTSRLDLALGFLGPDVTSKYGTQSAKSKADAFWMPAVGWARRNGALTYGVGLFGQGGMGTEYGADTFLAAGSGDLVRSEVSFGRLIFPLVYTPDERLTVGGSLDFVWAGMDLKMAMSGADFADFVAGMGGSQTYGTATGTMVDTLVSMVPGTVTDVDWARFDFSNGSDFTGEAKGSGWAGKLGFTYKVNERLTVGGVYQTKTDITDLDTSRATVTMQVDFAATPPGSNQAIPVTGTIRVRDFQWPAIYGVGLAFQATERLLLAADVKRLEWSDTMKNFRMSFVADSTQANPLAGGFAGKAMDVVMYQNWDDQTVWHLGLAYQATPALTLRFGLNLAGNPVPDKYVHPLFPATIKDHVMGGFGYRFGPDSEINFSVTVADKVTVTNGKTIIISHEQVNWQLMYTRRFGR